MTKWAWELDIWNLCILLGRFYLRLYLQWDFWQCSGQGSSKRERKREKFGKGERERDLTSERERSEERKIEKSRSMRGRKIRQEGVRKSVSGRGRNMVVGGRKLGRIIGHNKIQFMFQSEETLNLVLHRSLRSYAECIWKGLLMRLYLSHKHDLYMVVWFQTMFSLQMSWCVLLKSRNGCPKTYMAIKTDINKTYDRVEWDFLESTVRTFVFSETWIAWIMAMVRIVRYSVLVNGNHKVI